MLENRKFELVFIPFPGRGHIMATMQFAKLLIDRDERLSVTMFLISDPFCNNSEETTLISTSRIRFIELPRPEPLSNPSSSPLVFMNQFISSHNEQVRTLVQEKIVNDDKKLAGFVVDMFCTSMIELAKEFDVPSYVFFTSGAAALSVIVHLQGLKNLDEVDHKNPEAEISMKSHKYPLPVGILPGNMFEVDGLLLLDHVKKFRETKGIVINSFLELESLAIKSLLDDVAVPPVYSIGPILHVSDDDNAKHEEVMTWLDKQPDSSVVFLCFGSQGSFEEKQVKEIAFALERSGFCFLWSLRKPSSKNFGIPTEYEDFTEVLPEGFLERTSGMGKIIGWAPQMKVLSHKAVGGFVSHCGWNSTLESIWCGVPMATWPLYAEQQMNAFVLVKELGIAVEIKMDYRKGSDVIVSADEIVDRIESLMETDSEVRVKFEAVKVKSRMALQKGGSSFEFVGSFVENVIGKIQ